MANIINQYGQVKLGVRYTSAPLTSSLWTSVYSVYNADSVGSSSLKTSLFAAYNGESNANDSFGSNNGTAQGGLTYTAGKIGNAFTFNGSNSYVALPTNSLSSLTGDLSISCWVNLTSLTSVQCFLSNYIYTAGINNEFIGFRLFYNTSGGVEFGLGDINSLSTVLKTNNYLTTNTWYNIVVTRKGSTRTKIYINGLQSVSNTDSRNPAYVTTYPAIGTAQYLSNNNTWFMSNGSKIDAVGIWNKELTASEVIELYNSGNGAQYITNDFYKPTTNDALNTYNGTAQGGLTYGLGKVGTAFQFNGSNSYVALPTNTLRFTGDFSVSLWVYIPIDKADNQTLIGCLRQPSGWRGWDINIYSNRIYFEAADAQSLKSYAYITSANIGSWKHVVATFKNGTGGKLYVDNVLRGSFAMTSPISYDSTDTPTIGCMNYAPGTTWFSQNGLKLDAISTWTKELTAADVTELYNSGNGKQYPN